MITRRAAGWFAAIAVAAAALVAGALADPGPRTNADRVYALAQDFACPVCDGQSVAESDAVVAREIRRQLAVWVDEGRDDAFIRERLVGIYGESVDYTPAGSGVASIIWVLPVVLIATGGAGLALVFRRWRSETPLEADADDVALVDAALSRGDHRRGER